MNKGTAIEVREHVAAPPGAVYAMVADVTRMGEWSPECVHAEWVDGATGPAVGARFKGSNRKGLARWSTTPRVVAADPGREFAFVVTDPRDRENTRWTYRFESASGGTDVTESFELLRDVPGAVAFIVYRCLLRVKDRRADLEANMRHSLAALKAAAEKAQSSLN